MMLKDIEGQIYLAKKSLDEASHLSLDGTIMPPEEIHKVVE